MEFRVFMLISSMSANSLLKLMYFVFFIGSAQDIDFQIWRWQLQLWRLEIEKGI